VRRDKPKVGRNDPCPCGSGKKYKKCHGKDEEAAREEISAVADAGSATKQSASKQ
jgi:hypothetical protein